MTSVWDEFEFRRESEAIVQQLVSEFEKTDTVFGSAEYPSHESPRRCQDTSGLLLCLHIAPNTVSPCFLTTARPCWWIGLSLENRNVCKRPVTVGKNYMVQEIIMKIGNHNRFRVFKPRVDQSLASIPVEAIQRDVLA